MANDFYTPTGSPATASSGSSAVVRAEFDALRQAFDKMPGLAANGGLPAFVNSGGTALEAANIATAQTRLGIVVSNELNGLANLNAVGLIARTGNGAYASRTLTGTANQIAFANGNGVSGNPTASLADPFNVGNIGVSGTLNAVFVVATVVKVGPTPAGVGGVRVPYGLQQGLYARNSGNSADISCIDALTKNSVADVVSIGASFSAGVIFKARSGGAAPSGADLSNGEWTVWRDTGGATTKLYYNNAGAIQSVALA